MRKAMQIMGILADTDVEWLATQGRLMNVAAEHVLIREGRPVEYLYFLLEGRLAVKAAGKMVATLLAGEVVGEISFVDSRPPMASVVAAEASRLLAIGRDKLQEKLENDTAFASRFYRALAAFLANRLRLTTGRLGFGDAGQDQDQADELDLEFMDHVSLGATRYDHFVKRLLRDGSGR